MRVRERLPSGVCGVSGGRPLLLLLRSVPARVIHGNTCNRLQEDQSKLPAKMHLDGKWARFGRPMGSAGSTSLPLGTDLLWYTTWWALMLVRRCRGLVSQFALTCGPLLDMLRKMRSSVVSSAYSSCFLLIPDLCS